MMEDRLEDLDDLLDGMAQQLASSAVPLRAGVPALSGRLYSAVTEYWPRLAVALVVLVTAVDLVIGGLTADSTVEFYAFAWATTTGGLWFLFEKAEKALNEESRARVVTWLTTTPFRSGIAAVPDQFAALFDRIFGKEHRSWRCFTRSGLASAITISVLFALEASGPGARGLTEVVTANASGNDTLLIGLSLPIVFLGTILLNIVPDYVSLVQTRWAIKWAQRSQRVVSVLFIGFVATLAVSVVFMFLVSAFAMIALLMDLGPPTMERFVEPFVSDSPIFQGSRTMIASYARIYFLSAFFTSVWLWLYILAWMGSRVLVRMDNGVGFLLRATDVERQPFRSMGFVSVIIASGLFTVGLPWVLL